MYVTFHDFKFSIDKYIGTQIIEIKQIETNFLTFKKSKLVILILSDKKAL